MSNIITFADAASRLKPIVRATSDQEPEPSYRDARKARRAERLAEVATNQNLTATCINSRMRISRRDAWCAARDLTSYWRARVDWHGALIFAQRDGVGDSDSFPQADYESRFQLLDTWREAVVKQLLTPAPDAGAVAWKRAKIRPDEIKHLPIKLECAERAIADDLAFLAAHPVRRKRVTS